MASNYSPLCHEYDFFDLKLNVKCYFRFELNSNNKTKNKDFYSILAAK